MNYLSVLEEIMGGLTKYHSSKKMFWEYVDILRYNAGGSENEDFYEELLKFV